MIRRVEALRYRCLRNVRRSVDAFQVLVGANASGKSTFLDVVRLLGQLVSVGLETAIRERTENLRDLIWHQEVDRFELAVEVVIPEDRRQFLQQPTHDTCRYEVAIGIEPSTGENAILAERVLLMFQRGEETTERELFPQVSPPARHYPDIYPRAGSQDHRE